MAANCLFCGQEIENVHWPLRDGKIGYKCKGCGIVQLTEECYEDFTSENFSPQDKNVISIVLRNEYEMSNHKTPKKYLKLGDLKLIIDQYNPLDPLAKMDVVLINISKKTKYVGETLLVDTRVDYPYYHCLNRDELESIFFLLYIEGLTGSGSDQFLSGQLYISAKGYQRLREIARPGKDSKQCFVAIWFTSKMDDAFEKAIKPAIEFKEKGESLPRFDAIKIDNFEHNNNINDEIIAQIRRSRFMVCDLTGYRGGIYFEAGFAYGLGLDVIYTFRKDWCNEQTLKDEKGEAVSILYDDS